MSDMNIDELGKLISVIDVGNKDEDEDYSDFYQEQQQSVRSTSNIDNDVGYWVDLVPYVLDNNKRLYLKNIGFKRNMDVEQIKRCSKILDFFLDISDSKKYRDYDTIKVNGKNIDNDKLFDFINFTKFDELKRDNISDKDIIDVNIPYIDNLKNLDISYDFKYIYNMIQMRKNNNNFFKTEEIIEINIMDGDYELKLDTPNYNIEKEYKNISENITNFIKYNNYDRYVFTFGKRKIFFTTIIIPSRKLIIAYLNDKNYDPSEIKNIIRLGYSFQIIYPYISNSFLEFFKNIPLDMWLVDLLLINDNVDDINQLIMSSIFKGIVNFGLETYIIRYNNKLLDVSSSVMNEFSIEQNDSNDKILDKLYEPFSI